MDLGRLLRDELVRHRLAAGDKWQAIRELVDVLMAGHEINLAQRPAIVEAVLERERSMTTGVGDGVAIPHGAVDNADHFSAALGVSDTGIDFEALDGGRVHIVVLLIVPRRSFGRHVRTLASVARLMNRHDLRTAIRDAEDASSVVGIIRAADAAASD